MKKDKKKKMIIIVLVALLCLTLVGVTYAYLDALLDSGTSADVDVTAGTTDSLMFSVGDSISIYATQQNFNETNRHNISDDTYVQADLIAGSDSPLKYDYYVYLDITANTLEYTTEDKQAELVLTVTDSNNNSVSINGLPPVTIEGISGYDITEATGVIELLSSTISATETVRSATDKWNITVTLINLDSNQNANLDKTFTADVMIQKEEIRFDERCNENTFACKIAKTYTTDGANKLYYFDGQGSYTNVSYEVKDRSFRYSGANPNNYVCFGSDASTCPTDNLYRIIGVFSGQVKLIKNDYTTTTMTGSKGAYSEAYRYSTEYYKGLMTTSEIASYYWNTNTGSNMWSESNLNTINLNTTYINYLGSTWTGLIETATWIVGGNSDSNIRFARVNNIYKNEITSPAASSTYSAKIGLMYVSDYGYAADPSAWSISVNEYWYGWITSSNWMYRGLSDMTITPVTGCTGCNFAINKTGYIVPASGSQTIRPSFYLKYDVAYSSGTGSADDPYRLKLD